MGEKGLLLAHDLGRHFQDGLGALVERADEPSRGLQAVGEIGLVLLVLRGLRDFGMVGLVDQHLGQGIGIELDDEAAVRPRSHEHIRHDRLHQSGPEGEAGLGVELTNFGDHVRQVFLAHAAESAQGRKIAFGQQVQMSYQRLHRGIEAVAFPELDGEAFGEIASTHARRIQTLQDRQHDFDLGHRRAELFADHRQIAAEITGLVDQVDEVLSDHAPRGIDHRERELPGEMIGQRGLDGDEGLEIVVAILAPARTGAGPFGIRRGRLAVRARRRRIGVGGRNIVELGTGLLGGCAVISSVAACQPIGGGTAQNRRCVAAGRWPIRVALAISRSLQQRIALEFALHVGSEVQIGQLQQLDGLHQLRRHDERMALPNFESLDERHVPAATPSLCALHRNPGPTPVRGRKPQTRFNSARKRAFNWSDSCISGSCPGVYQFRAAVAGAAAHGPRIAGRTPRRGNPRRDKGGGPRDRSRCRPCGPPSGPGPNR